MVRVRQLAVIAGILVFTLALASPAHAQYGGGGGGTSSGNSAPPVKVLGTSTDAKIVPVAPAPTQVKGVSMAKTGLSAVQILSWATAGMLMGMALLVAGRERRVRALRS